MIQGFNSLIRKERQITMNLNNENPIQIVFYFNANIYSQMKYITKMEDIIITYQGKLLGKEEEFDDQIYKNTNISLNVYTFQWIVDFLLIEYQKLLSYQKTKQTEKPINIQQNGLFKKIFCQQEADNYKQILIHNYEQKISQLKSNISNLSELKPLLSDCNFCHQVIDMDQIQLSCYHNYHEGCFQDLVKAQLLQQSYQLKCICKVNISKQTLKLCNNFFAAKSLMEIHVNELEQIKRKYNLQTCSNKKCGFCFLKKGPISTRCVMCNQLLIII